MLSAAPSLVWRAHSLVPYAHPARTHCAGQVTGVPDLSQRDKSWAVPGRTNQFPPPHQGVNSFQWPSETTSTVPSTTFMAVWSSIAYIGTGTSAAILSALAMELSG